MGEGRVHQAKRRTGRGGLARAHDELRTSSWKKSHHRSARGFKDARPPPKNFCVPPPPATSRCGHAAMCSRPWLSYKTPLPKAVLYPLPPILYAGLSTVSDGHSHRLPHQLCRPTATADSITTALMESNQHLVARPNCREPPISSFDPRFELRSLLLSSTTRRSRSKTLRRPRQNRVMTSVTPWLRP